jgi:hypothetical protein
MFVLDQLVAAPGQMARTLRGLEELASNTSAILAEFRGMRDDIALLIEQVEGLRADVRVLGGDTAPMRTTMETIDARIEGLALDLGAVSALADRVGRFGRRRAARNAAREEPEDGEPGAQAS